MKFPEACRRARVYEAYRRWYDWPQDLDDSMDNDEQAIQDLVVTWLELQKQETPRKF